MKKVIKLGFLSLLLCLQGSLVDAQETITVAVASSLYPAMQKQAEAFEKEHDVSIQLVSGSTGRLYNQIMQGAPFDLFIAAEHERPELLSDQGKALSLHHLGQGYLGVTRGKGQMIAMRELTDASVRHIAIANPDVAPFGKVAKAALQQQGLWQGLKAKFVYAQNAMQANMMVNNGLVDAGLVPVSSSQHAIAVVDYHAVLLVDKVLAKRWLKKIVGSQDLQLALQKP